MGDVSGVGAKGDTAGHFAGDANISVYFRIGLNRRVTLTVSGLIKP